MTEVIVAMAILVPICISIFALYNALREQETLLHSKMILSYYSNYIWDTLRNNDIPTNLINETSAIYINKIDNGKVEFNKNPIYYQNSWWFSKDIKSSWLFFQEIFYAGKDTLEEIPYYHYKIKTQYNWYSNIFYVTK